MPTRYWVHVEDRSGDSVDQLQCYIDDIKSLPFLCDYSLEELILCDVVITPAVLALVVELLCLPLSPDTVFHQVQEEVKWNAVKLYNCSLTVPQRYPWRVVTNGRPCTPDKVHHLFSLMTIRAQKLLLSDCCEVMAGWMSFPRCDPMILDELCIYQSSPLSSLQFANLGEMIQKSQLQELSIGLQFDDAALLLNGMAKAFHVRELTLLGRDLPSRCHLSDRVSSPLLSALVNLLQNPLSQLQELFLGSLVMDDCQMATIAQALPASQLRCLQVPHKCTRFRGLLEFAHQLPRIQNLKTVVLSMEDWDKSRETVIDYEECGNAWVQGLKANYSIEETNVIRLFQGIQSDLMEHYTRLNRAGKRVLATSLPVPAGLWPFFLERAMKRCAYKPAMIKADTVFFFLKNCPIISMPLRN